MKKKTSSAAAPRRYHPIVYEIRQVERSLKALGVKVGDRERYAVHLLVEAGEILDRSARALAALRAASPDRGSTANALDKAVGAIADLEVNLCVAMPSHLRELRKALPRLMAAMDAAVDECEGKAN